MTHLFEKSGLGRAPFKLISSEQHDPKVHCEFCNKAINYRFVCECSDGKRFGVGSECVKKYDPALSREIDTALKELKRKADEDRVAQCKAVLAKRPQLLKDKPHPTGLRGKSCRDYVEFCFENGGLKAQVAACVWVEQGLKSR